MKDAKLMLEITLHSQTTKIEKYILKQAKNGNFTATCEFPYGYTEEQVEEISKHFMELGYVTATLCEEREIVYLSPILKKITTNIFTLLIDWKNGGFYNDK